MSSTVIIIVAQQRWIFEHNKRIKERKNNCEKAESAYTIEELVENMDFLKDVLKNSLEGVGDYNGETDIGDIKYEPNDIGNWEKWMFFKIIVPKYLKEKQREKRRRDEIQRQFFERSENENMGNLNG